MNIYILSVCTFFLNTLSMDISLNSKQNKQHTSTHQHLYIYRYWPHQSTPSTTHPAHPSIIYSTPAQNRTKPSSNQLTCFFKMTGHLKRDCHWPGTATSTTSWTCSSIIIHHHPSSSSTPLLRNKHWEWMMGGEAAMGWVGLPPHPPGGLPGWMDVWYPTPPVGGGYQPATHPVSPPGGCGYNPSIHQSIHYLYIYTFFLNTLSAPHGYFIKIKAKSEHSKHTQATPIYIYILMLALYVYE